MKRIGLIALVVAMMAAMLLSGCSAKQESGDYYANGGYAEASAAVEEPAYDAEKTTDESGGAGNTIDYDNSVLQPGVNRKIVYEGNISAQTTNYEEDYNAILAKLQALGGYVEQVSSSGTKPASWQDEGRHASMTLRVPNAKFSEFMSFLGDLGETQSVTMSGRDISLEYYNTEKQIESLRKREARLQVLLDKAETMKDIIDLEDQLAAVSDQIEALETQVRTYDSLIDFSTVTINLQEVMEITEVAPPTEKTLGERISSGFYSVLTVLADIGEGLLVFFISGIPVWIILAVILVPTIILVRRARKKRKQYAALHPQAPLPGVYPGNSPFNQPGGYMGNPPYNPSGEDTGNLPGDGKDEK